MGSGASGSVNRERKWIIIGAYQFARENSSVHHSGIFLGIALDGRHPSLFFLPFHPVFYGLDIYMSEIYEYIYKYMSV